MGCVNNCAARAVRIVYWGKTLMSCRDFLEKHQIRIPEPAELGGTEE